MAAGSDVADEESDPAGLHYAMLTLQQGELRAVFKDFEQWLGKPGVLGQPVETAANDEDADYAAAAE